jgi:hypothetical protein
MYEDKTFLLKDKTGRGITNPDADIAHLISSLGDDELESDNGENLEDWADDAEIGDEWENRTMLIVCTKG